MKVAIFSQEEQVPSNTEIFAAEWIAVLAAKGGQVDKRASLALSAYVARQGSGRSFVLPVWSANSRQARRICRSAQVPSLVRTTLALWPSQKSSETIVPVDSRFEVSL